MRRAICSGGDNGTHCLLITSDNEKGDGCTSIREDLIYDCHNGELVAYRDDCPLVKVVLLDEECPVRLAPAGWPNGKRHK